MKNILLIGGSYGIGLSLVKKLSENFIVYTACRTNENLNSENANFIKFDALNDTIDTSLLPLEIHQSNQHILCHLNQCLSVYFFSYYHMKKR